MRFQNILKATLITIAMAAFGGCGSDGNPEDYVETAKQQLENDQFDAAIENCNKAIALDAEHIDAYLCLGNAYQMKQEYVKAAESYDDLLKIDPSNDIGFSNRGQVKSILGKEDEAIVDFDSALDLNPENISALVGRGKHFSRSKKYVDAIAEFSRAIELDPQHVTALIGRANAYGFTGKFENAENDMTRAIRVEADPQRANWTSRERALLFIYRGHWREKRQDYAGALSDLEMAVKCDFDYELAHFSLAKLRSQVPGLVDPEKAVFHAERACELTDWTESRNIEMLANAHYVNGALKEAIRCQRLAIETSSEGFDLEQARKRLKILQAELAARTSARLGAIESTEARSQILPIQ